MKLHLDRDAFKLLIEKISNRSGFRTDVIEKDYYVVLILNELSELQNNGLPAYFKGGTALYKALKTTNRFSEDIDLSVDTRNLSSTQNDKLLDLATKKYKSLSRNSENTVNHRSEVITMYDYNPITVYDKNDSLQRFGKLKVEVTSFTISEPVEDLEISALLYDLATNDERQILTETYDVFPFAVKTITIERIFIDKLFAAEAYTRRSNDNKKAFEAAKHIYDLSVMYSHEKIMKLMNSTDGLGNLINIRVEEELNRHDGIPGINPIDFTFFNDIQHNSNIIDAYETMQNQYVLNDKNRIDFEDAIKNLTSIQSMLLSNPAWTQIYFENELHEDETEDQDFGMKML